MSFRLDDASSNIPTSASCRSFGDPRQENAGTADFVAHVQELHSMCEQGCLSRKDYERNVSHFLVEHLSRQHTMDIQRILHELESLRLKGLISHDKLLRLNEYVAHQHKNALQGKGVAGPVPSGFAAGASPSSLYGVTGMLFAVCTILALVFPLLGLLEMAMDWSTLQLFAFNSRLHGVLAPYFYADMASTGIFSLLFVTAGILMWRQSPAGIRLAKGLLLARMFVGLAELLYLQHLSIGGFKQTSIFKSEFAWIILGVVMVGLLLLYLERSRQVRTTYSLA